MNVAEIVKLSTGSFIVSFSSHSDCGPRTDSIEAAVLQNQSVHVSLFDIDWGYFVSVVIVCFVCSPLSLT